MNNRFEQAIEDYLDQLCAQLGELPPEIQRETREELRGHLEGLAAMQRDPQHVIESALRQFGDAREIGRRLALEWEEGQWSLSGLTLLQRINKIRDSGAIEVEVAKPSVRLKVLGWVQVALLMFNFHTLSLQGGTVLGPRVSHAALEDARLGLFGLYFVTGMLACAWEWKEAARRSASGVANGNRAWSNIISRAGGTVLIPCLFLLPDQSLNISSAMILLCAVLAVLQWRQPSARARLAFKGSLVYGLVMGAVIGIVNGWLFFRSGFGDWDWLWLLLLPVTYGFGSWFWKRPPLRTSRKARVLWVLAGVLILASGVTRAIAKHNAKAPGTPQELVESWADNGAYLAGDTDTAFMRAHMPQAIPALRMGMSHPNSHVRMETANTIEGLGALAKPLIPDIESRLGEEDNQPVRIYLAMTFGGIGDTSAKTIGFLQSTFRQESHEEVKTYLAGSLVRLTAPHFDPQAWAWMLESLQPGGKAKIFSPGWLAGGDSFWDRRWAAAYMLQSMGAAARPALPALKNLRDDAATPWRVKRKVEQAIKQIQ